MQKDIILKIFRSSKLREETLEVKCSLVVEEIDIDLTAEDTFDVLTNHNYKMLKTEADAEEICMLLSKNLVKIRVKMDEMNVTGFMFITFRFNKNKEQYVILLPELWRIHKLPEESEKLEVISSILLDCLQIQKKFEPCINSNLYLKTILHCNLLDLISRLRTREPSADPTSLSPRAESNEVKVARGSVSSPLSIDELTHSLDQSFTAYSEVDKCPADMDGDTVHILSQADHSHQGNTR